MSEANIRRTHLAIALRNSVSTFAGFQSTLLVDNDMRYPTGSDVVGLCSREIAVVQGQQQVYDL